MKVSYKIEKELVCQRMLSIPVVDICEIKQEANYGFDVKLEVNDGCSLYTKEH